MKQFSRPETLLFYMFFLFLSLFLAVHSEANSAENLEPEPLSKSYEITHVFRLPINTAIGPAVLSFLESSFNKIAKIDGAIALIELNTPGGLVSTTKDIITLMARQPFPIIIWITPAGASATSAGAIIASSASLIFMSPGTNIGAATPIEMSGDLKEGDMRAKAVNDLVALVRSLATLHGRSANDFELMIKEAASFEAQVALEKNIINGLANNEEELFASLSSHHVSLQGKNLTLSLKGSAPHQTKIEFDLGQRILNFLASPTLAYMLFMIGAALIYLEFQAPGGFIAGSLGALFLVMAGIGFQVLPLNIGALMLIFAGIVLLILEVYITSYGVLSLAGIGAMTAGSLFLFRTSEGWITLENSFIFSTMGAVIVFMAFILVILIRSRQHKKEFFSLKNHRGVITEVLEKNHDTWLYQVKIDGERWSAHGPGQLSVGDDVLICQETTVDGESKRELKPLTN